MKSFDSDIKKYAHKMRLGAAERNELRERIVAYMEYHPLPHGDTPVDTRRGFVLPIATKTLIARVSHFNTKVGTKIAAGVFAVALLVTVPFAAEQAAPGDALYLVKTRVNEPVLAQFVNSPYEKVAFETTLMERRIAEARLLAKEGKLDEKTEAALALSIEGHANAAQKGINSLKTSDAESAAIAEITFGSALDVQTAVLDNTVGEAGEGIAGVVREAKFVVDAGKSTTTPSYARLMAHVEQETTRAFELFNAIKNSATPEERANIERRFADMQRKIASAQEQYASRVAQGESDVSATSSDTVALMTMSAKAPSDVDTLSATLGDIKKLILFMTDIDVRNSVALDQLVPVVPTPEEELTMQLKDIKARKDAVTKHIAEMGNAAVVAEIEAQLLELDSLLESAEAARTKGDTEAIERALSEMYALLGAVELRVMERKEGTATSSQVRL
jgi:hypothetical protein